MMIVWIRRATSDRLSSCPRLLVDAVQYGEDIQATTLHNVMSKYLPDEVLQLIEVNLQAVGLVGSCIHQMLDVAVPRALPFRCCEAQSIYCVKCSYKEQKVIK